MSRNRIRKRLQNSIRRWAPNVERLEARLPFSADLSPAAIESFFTSSDVLFSNDPHAGDLYISEYDLYLSDLSRAIDSVFSEVWGQSSPIESQFGSATGIEPLAFDLMPVGLSALGALDMPLVDTSFTDIAFVGQQATSLDAILPIEFYTDFGSDEWTEILPQGEIAEMGLSTMEDVVEWPSAIEVPDSFLSFVFPSFLDYRTEIAGSVSNSGIPILLDSMPVLLVNQTITPSDEFFLTLGDHAGSSKLSSRSLAITDFPLLMLATAARGLGADSPDFEVTGVVGNSLSLEGRRQVSLQTGVNHISRHLQLIPLPEYTTLDETLEFDALIVHAGSTLLAETQQRSTSARSMTSFYRPSIDAFNSVDSHAFDFVAGVVPLGMLAIGDELPGASRTAKDLPTLEVSRFVMSESFVCINPRQAESSTEVLAVQEARPLPAGEESGANATMEWTAAAVIVLASQARFVRLPKKRSIEQLVKIGRLKKQDK